MTAEQTSSFRIELPSCPHCHAETSVDDSFCQECGTSLASIKAASDAFDSSEDCSGRREAAPLTSGLQCASLVSTSSRSTPMARLHPRRAKPVVALPLIILALAALALTPFCLMSFEKTYSGFSNKYASEQALKAYKENRFDEAATVLERLAVGHKLDDEQRLLLNNVYFSRADFRALHLDYNNAIADLANITPDFSKSRLVAQKKHDYLELLKEQAKAQLQAAQAKVKEANQLSSRSTQIALKSQSTVSTKVKAAVKENETTSPIKAVSKPVTVPENSEAQGEQKTDAQTANLPSQPVTVAKSSARSKYSENDVVRYNELLAGYFSQDRKSSSSPAEPPSLKEWIDLGKPSF